MRCVHVPARATVALVAAIFSACTDLAPVEEELPTRFPAAERVVAIGDLHGDLKTALTALRLGGIIDEADRWIGGDIVLVQTGDILDRGDEEEAVIRLFERLSREATEAGGAVHVLNGNHELMNAYRDYRYVTPGGYADFEDADADFESADVDFESAEADLEDVRAVEADSFLAALEPSQRARAAAFLPGGPFARLLTRRNTIAIVGKSLFVHGGVLPEHADRGLDAMNEEIRAWLRAEAPQPEWIRGERSPVWTRLYSNEPDAEACDTLSSVLDRLGLERMVVGHTVQRTGITSFCGGRVWCIDVGIAAYYGGRPEVLEIRGGVVKGLR